MTANIAATFSVFGAMWTLRRISDCLRSLS